MDTDKNWKSFGPEYNGQTITPDNWENPPPGTSLSRDDIFKVTGGVENFGCDGITIAPGGENNFDAVRGKNLFCRRTVLEPGARQGPLVFKGSIDGWEVSDGDVPNGPKFGIEVGQFDNYWYPGRLPTRRGLIRNVNQNSEPVLVILWDADTPVVESSNVRFKRIPKWQWLPYFLLMYVWVRVCGAKTK